MKDIFKKIANLVVEVPESPSVASASAAAAPDDGGPKVRKTIADLVRESPGPNLEDVHVPVPPSAAAAPPPPPVVDAQRPEGVHPGPVVQAPGPLFSEEGQVDVQAIYAKANLPASPFTAEQAYEMIQGLPPELPIDTKRQMVKVMLTSMGKTLGVTPETIVTDAARKAAALESFVEGMTKQAEGYIQKVEAEIRELEARIATNRQSIEKANKRIADLQASCEVEANRLGEAAEFFSTDGPKTQKLD